MIRKIVCFNAKKVFIMCCSVLEHRIYSKVDVDNIQETHGQFQHEKKNINIEMSKYTIKIKRQTQAK